MPLTSIFSVRGSLDAGRGYGRSQTVSQSRSPIRVFSSSQQRSSLYTKGEATQTRQRLFGDIAPVYDELNEKLSLGQHKVWKRMTVNWTEVQKGQRCLDLCCGSGDLTFLLAEAAGKTGEVVGLDFAPEMLDYARDRERQQQSRIRPQANIEWVEGDATDLQYDDQSFDVATMGYGLRNVASIPQALKELWRVLRPGGKAAILDFNNVSQSNGLLDFVQGWALDNIVVPSARSYGLEEEYQYLRPSILSFPPGRKQEVMAKEAGFKRAVHYEIGFGLMGVLVVQKDS